MDRELNCVLIEGVPHVPCDGCDNMVPATQQTEAAYPDNGVSMTLDGWYGGFFDNFSGRNNDADREKLTLCHDCAVKVYDLFPRLAAQRGLHPSEDGKPCCAYWWGFDGDMVVHGDGSTIPLVNGVLTQKALDDYEREHPGARGGRK